MLRISLLSQTPHQTVLKVEGWLEGEQVALLEAEGQRRFDETELLVLDLDGLRYIGAEGIALLQGWQGAQLELRGGSGFIRKLLADDRP